MAVILVAEDDAAVRDLVALNLVAEGHDVRPAANGVAALRELRQGGLDAVVLDIMLPGMDGLALLAERVRLGLAPTTRIVMLTARADDRTHLRAFRLGCDAYVTKPFAPDELVAVVHRMLAASNDQLARHRRRELRKADALDQVDRLMGAPPTGR